MYIESKLKEIDKTLFSLNLNEVDEPHISSEEIYFRTPCGVEVNSKIQFGRDFFTADTHIENDRKLTDIFKISGNYIQVSYLGKGESRLVFSKKSEEIGSGRIQYCCKCDTENVIEMPECCPTHYQVIFLSVDYYLNLLKNEAWAAESVFYNKVKNEEKIKMGEYTYSIDYKFHELLNQITKSEWDQDFKKYYLELKLKELFLCLHLNRQEKSTCKNGEISGEQLAKVKSAHAILIEDYKNPPTIKVLARSVLLNELHLKKGFKELYGKTIRSFVIELRMEKAKSLVGKYTVNEVAGILGYKSVPHFINTFKKYYGFTPKQSLNQ